MILGLIALVLLLSGCDRESPVVSIDHTCQKSVARAAAYYNEANYEAHAREVGRFLGILSSLPLSSLRACENTIRKASQSGDVRAHLSVLVDLAYRLSRSASPSSADRLERLGRTVRSKLASRPLKNGPKSNDRQN